MVLIEINNAKEETTKIDKIVFKRTKENGQYRRLIQGVEIVLLVASFAVLYKYIMPVRRI